MEVQFVREKEAIRQKMNETETRSKEIEARRKSLVFEIERERTHWNIEAEKLKARNAEL